MGTFVMPLARYCDLRLNPDDVAPHLVYGVKLLRGNTPPVLNETENDIRGCCNAGRILVCSGRG